jgi:hypothetical protein
MVNKLWIFGDSFSAPYTKISKKCEEYIEWKGYEPKVYGDVLGEKLGMEVINTALGGLDNYSIFESFCNSVEKMKKGDAVVIGWSETTRFRLVKDLAMEWQSIIINDWHNNPHFNHISKDSINEIGVNRMSMLYWIEVMSWSKLIQFTLNTNGIDVLFFTPFTKGYSIIPADWRIQKLERIVHETNGNINDWHHNEKSNHILGVELYDRLINKKNNKGKII